jgi:putative acid phosphatase of HAD superfamily subfamily IIIB
MTIGSLSRKRVYALAATAAAAVTAAGLIGTGVASAQGSAPTAATVHATQHATAKAPHKAGDIPNLGLVELKIEAYYGDPNGTGVASATSNYAKQTDRITARTERYLKAKLHHHGHGKPALVLDIDDTSLITYGYEISQGFGFTPASNLAYLQTHTLPAVFGMTTLANWANSHGITIFWITGRHESQRGFTSANLPAVGYQATDDTAHLFMKPDANPPAYLTCGLTCTTIQYKSMTRGHIASMGYNILANMGDQFSDLKGGFADRSVKMPNPMYYIP